MRYSKQLCLRFQHGAEILGKRWTAMILDLLLNEGPKRFNEIAGLLEVVSDRVLSERLKELEAEGIVRREVCPDTPVRVEYHLTEKGEALRPVMDSIHAWAEGWIELTPELTALAEE
jgi:DNA-binding HxlR family transcriptional regulator